MYRTLMVCDSCQKELRERPADRTWPLEENGFSIIVENSALHVCLECAKRPLVELLKEEFKRRNSNRLQRLATSPNGSNESLTNQGRK